MCEEKVLLLTPTMKALLFKCTFCFQVHSDSEYYTAEQSGSKYKLKVAKKNQREQLDTLKSSGKQARNFVLPF